MGRFLARPYRKQSYERGKMNKLEQAYAEYLDAMIRDGMIREWAFEDTKLRLADKTFYTPDFRVLSDCIELHEVKGFWQDDARVKWKATADRFWFYKFVAVTRKKGEWLYEVYGNA